MTHHLQPLDVGVFSPLQRAWQHTCANYLESYRVGMAKKNVIEEYMKAKRCAFKEETILQSWQRCRIRPINPGIFTEEDYTPSYETSTHAHVPLSFPRLSTPEVDEDMASESDYLPSETEKEESNDIESEKGENENDKDKNS